MSRQGAFCFGDTWAAYWGPARDHTVHTHAAFQIVVGNDEDVVVRDGDGGFASGGAFLIRPMVRHAVSAQTDLSFLYVESQSPLASALLEMAGPGGVTRLSRDTADLMDFSGEVDQWFSGLGKLLPAPPRAIDPRLSAALGELSREPGATTIANVARNCGLSESRLRTLSREQLGLPLSTWLIWRKLERAARALAGGAGLAEAALEGGFADQAHFARSMRRMFGVPPRVASAALT